MSDDGKKDEDEPSCMDSICNNKMAVALVIVGIGLLVAFVLLIALPLAESFPTREACVACVAGGNVYNQSGSACTSLLASNFSVYHTNSTDQLVDDSAFCGKAACAFLSPIKGLRSPPHLLVLFSSYTGICISAVIAAIKIFLIRPLCCGGKKKKRKRKGGRSRANTPANNNEPDNEDADDDEEDEETKYYNFDNLKPADKYYVTVLEILGSLDSLMFLILYMVQIAELVALCLIVRDTPEYADVRAAGAWEMYQTVIVLWLNSGAVEVVGIVLTNFLVFGAANAWLQSHSMQKDDRSVDRESNEKNLMRLVLMSTWAPMVRFYNAFVDCESCCGIEECCDIECDCCYDCDEDDAIEYALLTSVVFALPLAAPLVTHVLPMCLVFFPIALILIVPFVFFGWLMIEANDTGDEDDGFFSYVNPLLFVFTTRVVGNFLVVMLFQMMVVYGVFLYRGMNWLDVLKTEYGMRDTECFAISLLNQVSSAQWQLASMVLS